MKLDCKTLLKLFAEYDEKNISSHVRKTCQTCQKRQKCNVYNGLGFDVCLTLDSANVKTSNKRQTVSIDNCKGSDVSDVSDVCPEHVGINKKKSGGKKLIIYEQNTLKKIWERFIPGKYVSYVPFVPKSSQAMVWTVGHKIPYVPFVPKDGDIRDKAKNCVLGGNPCQTRKRDERDKRDEFSREVKFDVCPEHVSKKENVPFITEVFEDGV